MKILGMVYRCGRSGVIGAGIAMIVILVILSFDSRVVDAKVDLNDLTNGWYIWLWLVVLISYVVGGVGVLANKAIENIRKKKKKVLEVN